MVYGNGSNEVKFPSVCMEYLYKHALDYLGAVRSETETGGKKVFLRKRLTRY